MEILNNAKSVIQSDIDLNTTEFIVQDPSLFPAEGNFRVTLEEINENGVVTAREIIEIETIVENLFKIKERNVEYCVQSDIGNKQRTKEAKNFSSGASISQYLTEEQYKAIETEISKKLNTTDFSNKWGQEMTEYVADDENFNGPEELLKLNGNGKVPAENIVVPVPEVSYTSMILNNVIGINNLRAVGAIYEYRAQGPYNNDINYGTVIGSTIGTQFKFYDWTTATNYTEQWYGASCAAYGKDSYNDWTSRVKGKIILKKGTTVVWTSSEQTFSMSRGELAVYPRASASDKFIGPTTPITLTKNETYSVFLEITNLPLNGSFYVSRFYNYRKCTMNFDKVCLDTPSLNIFGIKLSNNGNDKKIATGGIIPGFSNLEINKKYYLQSDYSISTTETPAYIGYAVSSTEIKFDPKISIEKTFSHTFNGDVDGSQRIVPNQMFGRYDSYTHTSSGSYGYSNLTVDEQFVKRKTNNGNDSRISGTVNVTFKYDR